MALRPAIALLVALLCLGGVAFAAPAGWDRPVSQRAQRRGLRSVLKNVYKAAQRGDKPIVVVDIDDTVADGRVRLRIAASRAGLVSEHLTSGGDLYQGLPTAEVAQKRDAFHALYFNDPKLAALDTAQRGAPSFLRAVQKAGGRVVYVSGRWESTRESTEAYLRHLDLPLGRSEDLLLNPSEKIGASQWKQQAQAHIAERGKPVAAFDNEAEAAAGYHDAFPGTKVFRLATFRFRDAPADKPRDLTIVKNFSLDR